MTTLQTARSPSTVRLHGAREMEQVLKQLPEHISRQVVVGALRDAAQPILDEARRLAPVGQESKGRVRLRRTKKGKVTVSNYGKLKLNLKIITLPAAKLEHSAGVAVSVGKAFWGMFVEFGTRHMGKKPFMRPAFEAKKMEALNILGKRLGERIEKAAEKLAGPYRKSGLRRR